MDAILVPGVLNLAFSYLCIKCVRVFEGVCVTHGSVRGKHPTALLFVCLSNAHQTAAG